jgi:hypothetical protein
MHGSMNIKLMNWGLVHSSGDRFISSPKHPVWFQNPLSLLFSRYQWFIPLVTFLHQVPRLRMKLTPPPLPSMTLWGVKVQLCDILHILTNLVRRSYNSLHPSCPMFSLLRPVHDITNWNSSIILEVFPNVLYLVFQDLFWQPVITPAICVFCITEILLLVEFLILSCFHHVWSTLLISQFCSRDLFLLISTLSGH